MTLSAAEFDATLRRLPGTSTPCGHQAALSFGRGTVSIGAEPMPPLAIGKLLRLPRMRVSFAFCGLTPAERDAFLAQRGGG